MPWISRSKFEEMKKATEATIKATQDMQKYAILIDIERNDRMNTFTFMRGNELFRVQTMGLISDDFGKWRKDLLQ